MTNKSLSNKKYRQKYPMKYAYMTLKHNAKRRGKEFTISFEYFKKFAIKVDYIDKKGINRDSYHIDRIKEDLGYIPGNLQLLKNVDNIKKYHRSHHDGEKMVYKAELVKNEPADDVPF